MLSPKSYSAKSQLLKHGEEKSGKNNRADVVKNYYFWVYFNKYYGLFKKYKIIKNYNFRNLKN